MDLARVALLVALAVVLIPAAGAADDWTQWGGPGRDFSLESRELSRTWAEEGPPSLWSRSLGGGFASIVSDGSHLYAHYRVGDDEIVAALNPKDGKTLWEHRYSAPVVASDSLSTQYGKGPNGTPLIVDGRIVTFGFMGHLRCLNTADGKLLWSHDLAEAFKVTTPYFGHATSPLVVGSHVVVAAGGLLAFDLKTGKAAWENRDFEASYGSPLLVGSGAAQQIVSPMTAHLAGFDPKTGKTLWSEKFENQWGTILTSPILDESGRVFISASQVGAMLVDPAAKGEGRRLWEEKKTQINHSNAVRDGKIVYATVGESANFVTATSLEGGKELWRARGFGQANFLRVGDDYILLDFEGELALVELTAEGMEIVAQATVNDKPTWTPPTLLGTTLYLRDEARLFALDLAKAEGK